MISGISSDLFSIGESAMNVSQARMVASADNVANVDTPDYQRKNVLVEERAQGGVKVSSIEREDEPVDLAREMVNMTRAKRTYEIAAKVIGFADETLQTVLEMGDNDD